MWFYNRWKFDVNTQIHGGWWDVKSGVLSLTWDKHPTERLRSRDLGQTFSDSNGFSMRCSPTSWWTALFTTFTTASTTTSAPAETCGGEALPNTCWYEFGRCVKPVVESETCKQIAVMKGRTDASSWQFCAGASVSAEVQASAAVTVAAEVSVEVCHDRAVESSAELTHTVNIPGRIGKTSVGCARATYYKVGDKEYFSYASGHSTVCFDACPLPSCEVGPADLVDAPVVNEKEADGAAHVSYDVITFVLVMAHIVLADVSA